MNKTIKSKNGSIVIGMFALFIVMTFIATMTVRMTNERNLNQKTDTSYLKESYEDEGVMEIIKNLVGQQILAKEYQKNLEEQPIGMADAIEIQTKIDEVVEEIYKGKYKVNIEIPNQTVKVKDYCEVDENVKYKCSMDTVSFQLKISKYKNNKGEILKLNYNGIKMIEAENGDKIKANVEELSIKMSN